MAARRWIKLEPKGPAEGDVSMFGDHSGVTSVDDLARWAESRVYGNLFAHSVTC